MNKYVGFGLMIIGMQYSVANADIMKDAYRNYDAGQRCYIAMNKTDSGIEKFCMKLHANETVANDQFPDQFKTYYLAVGNNELDYHVATGNIGLIIEDNGDGSDSRILAQEKFISAGSSGYAPTDYKFNKIGFNSYGFFTETGYTAQGISQGGMLIIGDNDGKTFNAYIPTYYDDSGYVAEDGEIESIEAKYKILSNDKNVMYPIEITMNGKYGGKNYQNQPYILNFDETTAQYILPSDYPFAESNKNSDDVIEPINTAFQGRWTTDITLCRKPEFQHDQQYFLTVNNKVIDLSGWNFGYTATVFNLNTNTDKLLDADIEYSTYFETESSEGIADIQLSINEKNRLLLGDTQTGTLFINCNLIQ